jgi:hypothetical protein
MNGTEKVRPSSGYYFLAAAFLLGGIALMILSLVSGIYRIRRATVRGEVPGQMDLELKQNETYGVFVEESNLAASGGISLRQASRTVQCQVNMLPSGQPILANRQASTSSYTYGTRTGVTILEFEVPKDGTYMIACQGPSQYAGQKVEFAVGGGVSKAISGVIKRSAFALIGGVVVGLLIFVRVAMLRLESRREIRERGMKPV